MGETFFGEIKRYVEFGAEDEERLVELAEVLSPAFGDVTNVFYERILAHEGARSVLASDAQVKRLHVSLRSWMERVFTGPWDEHYFARGARIGRMHVKVGLSQRYMVTAMNVVRTSLHQLVSERIDSDRAPLARLSIDKALDLELAIMLHTYNEDIMDRVRRVARLERDVLQRRLEISEARYQSIVETAEVLVVAVARDHDIVLFNRKAESVTGYLRSEVVGQDHLELLFHADERERLSKALTDAFEGGEVAPWVARVASKRGDIKWVRWQVTTLPASGEPVVCAIGVDLTDERLLEDQTRRAERLVALGTLAAGLAHEIRNPLNAAQLQLLLVERRVSKLGADNPAASSALEAARVVRDEMSRLALLVQDFLDFARPSALRLDSGELNRTVNEVLTLLRPDFESAGVELETDLEPVVATYDEERIKQVAHNLLRNAMEAAGPGGRVAISARRAHDRVVLEVVDSGAGPPDDVDWWEPFATSKAGGTGLGLSIVHRIITEHGGNVSFKRRGGKTVFTLDVPVVGPHGD